MALTESYKRALQARKLKEQRGVDSLDRQTRQALGFRTIAPRRKDVSEREKQEKIKRANALFKDDYRTRALKGESNVRKNIDTLGSKVGGGLNITPQDKKKPALDQWGAPASGDGKNIGKLGEKNKVIGKIGQGYKTPGADTKGQKKLVEPTKDMYTDDEAGFQEDKYNQALQRYDQGLQANQQAAAQVAQEKADMGVKSEPAMSFEELELPSVAELEAEMQDRLDQRESQKMMANEKMDFQIESAQLELKKRLESEREKQRRSLKGAALFYGDPSLVEGIRTGGEKFLQDLEQTGQMSIKQLVMEKESYNASFDAQTAQIVNEYVTSRQGQIAEANKQKREQAMEMYKFERQQAVEAQKNQMQMIKDFPEYFEPTVIDGKVTAKVKSATEREAAKMAAQYGESMDLIAQAKETFGEDSPVGQSIILNELSKYGYEDIPPELLFPPDKKTLEDQLGMISKFGDLPPEVLNRLAMGGQIFGMEMDAQDAATLQALSQGFAEAAKRDFMTKDYFNQKGYQTFTDNYTGQTMVFDPNTGEMRPVSGMPGLTGGGYNISASSAGQNIQSMGKISKSSKVSTTINPNGVYEFGKAVNRVKEGSYNKRTGKPFNMGHQCGGYVNDVLGQKIMGNSWQSKEAQLAKDPNSKTGFNMKPIAGGYFVMGKKLGTTWGHTGMVNGVEYNEDGTLKGVHVTHYNWKGLERRHEDFWEVGSHEWNLLSGFGAPGVKSLEGIQKLGQVELEVEPKQLLPADTNPLVQSYVDGEIDYGELLSGIKTIPGTANQQSLLNQAMIYKKEFGQDGGGEVSQSAEDWANAIDEGFAKISNVPEEERTAVIQQVNKNAEERMNQEYPELTKAQRDEATRLRKEITGHPKYGDMVDREASMTTISTLYGPDSVDSASGLDDVAAVNAFQRLIDPGATVREGDITLLETTIPYLERIDPEFKWDQFKKGDKLPASTRRKLYEVASDIYSENAILFNSSVGNQYKKLAEQADVPYELISSEFLLPGQEYNESGQIINRNTTSSLSGVGSTMEETFQSSLNVLRLSKDSDIQELMNNEPGQAQVLNTLIEEYGEERAVQLFYQLQNQLQK